MFEWHKASQKNMADPIRGRFKYSLEGYDLRLSLNIMVNYDGHIAGGFEKDERASICSDQQKRRYDRARVCTFVPELGTIWRTDVMLGAGYHF